MATTQLSLYNGALRECHERKLASLSENREARRLLDDVWTNGRGLIDFVLQSGQWRFASRTVALSLASGQAAFGATRAAYLPADFVRFVAVTSDADLQIPLLDYRIEGNRLFAYIDTVYLTYVSNDDEYGGDLQTWPSNFCLYVETHMASLIVGRLTGSSEARIELIKLAEMRRRIALEEGGAIGNYDDRLRLDGGPADRAMPDVADRNRARP